MDYSIKCLSIEEVAKDEGACVVLIFEYKSEGIEEILKFCHFKAVYGTNLKK